jgi:hypothetical protein
MNKESTVLVTEYMPLAESIAWRRSRLVPKSVTVDELKSVAYLGLVDAALRFDPSKGAFANYARTRISGEITDFLRRERSFVNLDEVSEPGYAQVFYDDFFDVVEDELGPSGGEIVRSYYVDGMTLKDIGRERGFSESRASQILGGCHRRMKRRFKEHA